MQRWVCIVSTDALMHDVLMHVADVSVRVRDGDAESDRSFMFADTHPWI